MTLKVIYVGSDSSRAKKILASGIDVILLHKDKWDDYDYKTRFPTHCQINKEEIELGAIKILFADVMTSFDHLDSLIAEGWNGEFPIHDSEYISTPESLSFYEQLEGHIGIESAIEVAELLRDAGFMTMVKDDDSALNLIRTSGFRKSLLRENGSSKAYQDGWRFLGKQSLHLGNLSFNMRDAFGKKNPINFIFEGNTLLPHDINVVIGPNGVGKSQLFQQIINYWLNLDDTDMESSGFSERPNISQLVAVAYSPFELFPVDIPQSTKTMDSDSYKYFGLRGKESLLSKGGSSKKIRLSRDFPRINASNALLSCLRDDQRFGGISNWSKKIKTLEIVLSQAIDFDFAALVLDNSDNIESLYGDVSLIDDLFFDVIVSDSDDSFSSMPCIPISSDRIKELIPKKIGKRIEHKQGIIFLKNGKPVFLSSGQRLFSYIVINILGAIRRNSLLLIDEPELFLHPNLEVAFIRMLKSILEIYASKAIIATHSLVTVRETPRDCVHVFEKSDGTLYIKNPPFETFGGDIQRISSYVFGDKSISKSYDDWLRLQVEKLGSPTELIAALGDNINEELIIRIQSMEN